MNIINSHIASTLSKKQREIFEKELNDIREKKNGKGSCAAIFSVKERVLGLKKASSEAVVLVDPKSGKEATSPEEIKKISLDYCTELLTNKEPEAEFEVDVGVKRLVHIERMAQMTADEHSILTDEQLEETFEKLSKKPGTKFSFITKGGESLKLALFTLCKTAWESEKLPSRWSESRLVQLYKGSGSKQLLSNYRFIHLKDEFQKFFGHLVLSRAKETLFKQMSKFQIGSRPGHRVQEHLFVLKSVIALYLKYDGSIILSMWDVKKYFDSENLSDCMNELFKNQIRGKLYRLIYKMNQNTQIRVQTPLGLTDRSDVGESVGQGTVDGAVISAVNLDNGVEDFFRNSEHEVNYGEIMLRPLLYQDDVARLSPDLRSAQEGNDRMDNVAASKLLEFHTDKSSFMIFGKRKRRELILKELESNPLTLSGKNMLKQDAAKYLGDYLSESGLSDSVAMTIKKRKPQAIRAIYEIRAVIDDCRSEVVGGLTAGFQLWEMSVLPMLLFNAECWFGIDKSATNTLENMQYSFLRSILGTGTGCPLPLLLSETGMILMELRVLKKKLIFLHHLTHLGEDTLAHEILSVQNNLDLPGLVSECKDFLNHHQISDLSEYSKLQWKRLVNRKICELNKMKLIELAKSKSYKKVKIEDLIKDDFSIKPYFKQLKVGEARLRFKFAAEMTPNVAMNFQSEKKYVARLWSCPGCYVNEESSSRDTQAHMLQCQAYAHLRTGKDLSKDKDLVEYIQKIINSRV